MHQNHLSNTGLSLWVLVLMFELTNALTFVMHLMNWVFEPHLYKFVVVFIDDIRIYSRTREEHTEHIQLVFRTLNEHKLYAKFKKCEFWLEKIHFLNVLSKEVYQSTQGWWRVLVTSEEQST